MAKLDLKSREYKVMLQTDPFAGSEPDVFAAAAQFWADVTAILDELDIPTNGGFTEVKARRRIRFLDTVEHTFNTQRYVVRERIDVESEERQLTLKFRHADRYLAADRDMAAKDEDRAETKFEEDVKPPFVSVFSYSTSLEIDHDVRVGRVRDVVKLFPGLHGALHGVDDDGELSIVRMFCARELVLAGAAVLLGKHETEAECAMVVWHDDDDATTPPVCVEFSFKYGDDNEDYRGSVTRDAHDILQALAARLPEWVHPEPRTKTAFVYG